MADQTCFAFELKNSASDLATLCERLEGIGGTLKLSRRSIFEINLALDELFTNIISYGYDDQAEHRVRMCISDEGDRLTIVVEDDGIPFNPVDRPPPDAPCRIDSCQIGGLGIHLVRNLMDEVAYRRCGGKNVLTLTKTIERT
jgi:anti-sigma regulatory factor (Ser/Thr protein kinase)